MGHLVKNKEIWSTYSFKWWTHCISNHYHLLCFLIDFEIKETEESFFTYIDYIICVLCSNINFIRLSMKIDAA